MSKESFHQLMNQYVSEAEVQRIEEARLLARETWRENVKQAVISGLVVALYVIAFYKHNEIRDTVATLFHSGEPEYQSIVAINDEIDSEKPGAATTPADPTSRKARLKDSMRKAKEHAAVVDQIMDDNLNSSNTETKKK